MTVFCAMGGFSGRIGKLENTKNSLEARTPYRDWGGQCHHRKESEINTESRDVAQNFKKFKRTTPRPSFADCDWDPVTGW